MALRPCSKCGVPCDEGNCAKHPKAARWRTRRPRVTQAVYASPEYRSGRRLVLRAAPGGRCVYCLNREATTADHIIPLAHGGAWGIPNLAPACPPCNTSKGPRTIAEWIRSGTASLFAHEWLGRGSNA